MVRRGTLVLRADGSAHLGAGHVMRCLALAEAWRDQGGRVLFAAAELSPALAARLQAQEMEWQRINPADPESVGWAAGAAWVVLDGYHLDAAMPERLSSAGHRVMVIDDYGHSTPGFVHLLLNPNLHASPALHAKHTSPTELLLGPRYCPLRREFVAMHPKSPQDSERPVSRVIISLGGADPCNRTLDVLRCITPAISEGMRVRVIAGGANRHLPSLQAWVDRHPEIELVVDAPRMVDHFLWADAGILPASTTALEAFRCGLPCILIASVDNQRMVAVHARAVGLGRVVEAYDRLDTEIFEEAWRGLLDQSGWRAGQTQRMIGLVDGQGCRRIFQAMDLYGTRLRRVTMDDARLLWEWANDREVREQSFHPEPIPWETHLRWLEARLAEPASCFFIAYSPEGEAIGQIRLQASGREEAVIHLNVAPAWRGQGVGARMIHLAERCGFRWLRAQVKSGNVASRRMFLGAGFQQVDEQEGVCHFQKEISAI